MTADPSGEKVPGPPQPDILLAALESSRPSSTMLAQLREDVAAVHDHPLAAGVEPLPAIRFEDEAPSPLGP